MVQSRPLFVMGYEIRHELSQYGRIHIQFLFEIDEPFAEQMVYSVRNKLTEDDNVAMKLRCHLAPLFPPGLVRTVHVGVPYLEDEPMQG